MNADTTRMNGASCRPISFHRCASAVPCPGRGRPKQPPINADERGYSAAGKPHLVVPSAFIRVHLRLLPPSAPNFSRWLQPSPVTGHSVPRRHVRQPTGTTGTTTVPPPVRRPCANGPPDSESVSTTRNRRTRVQGRRRHRGRTRRDTEIAGQLYVGRVHPPTTRDRMVYRASRLARPVHVRGNRAQRREREGRRERRTSGERQLQALSLPLCLPLSSRRSRR